MFPNCNVSVLPHMDKQNLPHYFWYTLFTETSSIRMIGFLVRWPWVCIVKTSRFWFSPSKPPEELISVVSQIFRSLGTQKLQKRINRIFRKANLDLFCRKFNSWHWPVYRALNNVNYCFICAIHKTTRKGKNFK